MAIVDMAPLGAYSRGESKEWPAIQLQAMEVIMNHVFLMNSNQLYITRTFFRADQVRHPVYSPCLFPPFHGDCEPVGPGFRHDRCPDTRAGLMPTIHASADP